jgi:AcrR family transcriptional regulator
MMAARSPPVHLGDADLGRHRHVCGLFDGANDAASVLVPFVVDGLARGDRVVHIVQDPKAYLVRLANWTDVSAAVDSGQLDVRSWGEAYLSHGAFTASRMLAYMRRELRDGRSRGFRATRIIGDMAWAREDVPGVQQLVAYESEMNRILARPRISVVCAYDTRRHSPGQIAEVRAAHPAAVQAGKLDEGPRTATAPAPRERILAAASLLFAETGVAQTGVDTLIEAAGVAKATFYRHFPSKDELIVAWLEDPRTRWFDRVRVTAEARASTPSELIPRLFEAIAEWLETDDFLGCPYLHTSVEVTDPSHPAGQAVRAYLAEVGTYLEERVAAAGHPDSARLGRELHALLAGSIALGVAHRTSSYTLAARDAADELLDMRKR